MFHASNQETWRGKKHLVIHSLWETDWEMNNEINQTINERIIKRLMNRKIGEMLHARTRRQNRVQPRATHTLIQYDMWLLPQGTSYEPLAYHINLICWCIFCTQERQSCTSTLNTKPITYTLKNHRFYYDLLFSSTTQGQYSSCR